MKIRIGFVSNSSSLSFIIDEKEYENTLDVALHAALIISERDIDFNQDSQEIRHKYQAVLNNLINLKEIDLDPSIAIHIPTLIYKTYIAKQNDKYIIDTDKRYLLDGLHYSDFTALGDIFHLYEKYEYFYLSQYDVLGVIPVEDVKECSDESHGRIEKIRLKSGQYVCPICDINIIEKNKLTSGSKQKDVELLMDILKKRY